MIIGIGIDILELSLINRCIDKYSDDVLSFIFTENEINWCRKLKEQEKLLFAVCFSAKESVSKALGTGLSIIDWSEIEVKVNNRDFLVSFHGKAHLLAEKKKFKHYSSNWYQIKNHVVTSISLEE
ncbi:ACP synthase [Bacillus pseudomycoides]|nr:ACP synthase [Bacillus pseudomycoides]